MNKLYYTAQFKKELAARSVPIDTLSLQLCSVKVFMLFLGYVPVGEGITGLKGFRKTHKEGDIVGMTSPKFISFQDSVRLHNRVTMRVVGTSFVDILSFKYKMIVPHEMFFSAVESKLVVQAKLQRIKKFPHVQVQHSDEEVLDGYLIKLVGEK